MNPVSLFSLENKTAVIFGGKGKIGLPITQALCRAGARVYVVSPSVSDSDKEILSLKNEGLEVYAIAGDHAHEEGISNLLADLRSRGHNPDIMVNSAVSRPPESYSREDTAENWLKSMNSNSLGTFICSKLFADAMAENGGGSIINISSIYGLVAPDPAIYEGTEMSTEADYPYNKGGMIVFSKYFASIYGTYNVRVNCIAPGGMFNSQPSTFVKQYNKRVPLGRMAEAEDLYGISLFLASDASKYITGTVIPVDGGLTTR